jgi:glycerol dehydrogenase-like iron-containing ADH family enzyme
MGLKKVRYGQQMVEAVGALLPERFAVLTMPDPWSLVRPRLQREPVHLAEISSMDEERVAERERSLPPVDAALGVGGGAAMDMAKYVSWQRGVPLYLLPTIASVDAAVTTSAAVRSGGKVRYVGEAIPELVGVDFPVVRSAPIHLNRAGVGDILSIHTALWDWKLAHERGQDPYSESSAAAVAAMLARMSEQAEDLRGATDEGVRLLFDLYNGETEVLEAWGNSRPEEGSEHFFAYNVEYVTGRDFVHGELVCLGVYVLSYIQDNRPDWVHDFLSRVGVRFRLSELGISSEELRTALLTLPAYVKSENLFYTVIDETSFDDALVDRILDELDVA